MKYACWRCDHEIPRTAIACSGCGKPLAPFPWLRTPFLPRRKACDAVIADYVERLDPFLSGLMGVCFAMVLLAGGLVWSKARENLATEGGTVAEVRAAMEEGKVPSDLGVMMVALLEESRMNSRWRMKAAVVMMISGSLGAYWVLVGFYRGRRRLAARRSAQEALGSSAGPMAPPEPGGPGGE